MELLARKAQIALAVQGRDLLEEKRTALLKEFFRVADTAMERSDALSNAAASARVSLALAESIAGTESVRSAALTTRNVLTLQVETMRIMGVRVPRIEQKRIAESSQEVGITHARTSLSIIEAATAFEREVEAIIALAEMELRLSRLASEIQRTSRRLNALDHFLIPRLQSEYRFIQMAMDERERADHFRLKLVKRALERKRSGSY
jgi:V/A-type H+-transporting ATPase subunit D